MDYRKAAIINQNKNMRIKHMAFAVEDIDAALKSYQSFLGVSKKVKVVDMPKSRTRVALFEIGNIEYQLCQSHDTDGRFAKWIKDRGQGGLHHICYIVENLDLALKKVNIALNLIDEETQGVANIIDTKAEVLWRLGKKDEAIQTINKAIILDPTNGYYQEQKTKFETN